MVCDGREYSLPSIDKINEVFEKKESTIESCLIRFSLELFCLKDNYGKKLTFFLPWLDMGADDIQLC